MNIPWHVAYRSQLALVTRHMPLLTYPLQSEMAREHRYGVLVEDTLSQSV